MKLKVGQVWMDAHGFMWKIRRLHRCGKFMETTDYSPHHNQVFRESTWRYPFEASVKKGILFPATKAGKTLFGNFDSDI